MSVTLAEFERAVRSHDLTFAFSDDPRWYRAGSAELERIKAMAAELPRHSVLLIWNSVVDEKISPGHREPFYWRE